MKFNPPLFHPNSLSFPAQSRTALILCLAVYASGDVCISILHAPGDDPNGYESASERWSPVQSIEKILLSVVSMLAGQLTALFVIPVLTLHATQNPTSNLAQISMHALVVFHSHSRSADFAPLVHRRYSETTDQSTSELFEHSSCNSWTSESNSIMF